MLNAFVVKLGMLFPSILLNMYICAYVTDESSPH